MECSFNRLLYFVRREAGVEVWFPSELWRAQRGMRKGPPQPINVILTDMGTKKRPRESWKGERVWRWRGADEARYAGVDSVGTHLRQEHSTEEKQLCGMTSQRKRANSHRTH